MPRRHELVHAGPVPPVGGRVLSRALVAAFNRVPGRVGRYEVQLVGEHGALLSEHLNSGRAPLMIVVSGGLIFPAPIGHHEAFEYPSSTGYGAPSYPELRAGWPWTRIAAIVWAISAEPPAILWHSNRHYAYWGETGYSATDIFISFRRSTLSVMAIGLNLTFAATFCGSRPMDRADYNAAMNSAGQLVDWGYMNRDRGRELEAYGLWARALRTGNPEAAPLGALASIGTGPEIWNSSTDPGGSGDPVGADDGERNEPEPEEFDDDGNPVYPVLPPAPVPGPDPDLSGSRFGRWYRNLLNPGPVVTLRPIRSRPVPAEPELVEAPEGCPHCRGEEPVCPGCADSGRCGNCGGPYPARRADFSAALLEELDISP